MRKPLCGLQFFAQNQFCRPQIVLSSSKVSKNCGPAFVSSLTWFSSCFFTAKRQQLAAGETPF